MMMAKYMGAGLDARLRRARVLTKHDGARSGWNQAGLGFSATLGRVN